MKRQDITIGTTILDEVGDAYAIQHINNGGLVYVYDLDSEQEHRFTEQEIANKFSILLPREIVVQRERFRNKVLFRISTMIANRVAVSDRLFDKCLRETDGWAFNNQESLEDWMDENTHDFTAKEQAQIIETLMQ